MMRGKPGSSNGKFTIAAKIDLRQSKAANYSGSMLIRFTQCARKLGTLGFLLHRLRRWRQAQSRSFSYCYSLPSCRGLRRG